MIVYVSFLTHYYYNLDNFVFYIFMIAYVSF